jgi:two-component system, chemotaxis family, response regulator Rcp1
MAQNENDRTVDILVVEDNPGDVRLLQEAFRSGRVRPRLRVARDGVEAIQCLRREPPYANTPLPDLILLDLNLPRKDGREVLAEIKVDPTLKVIPVVVFTTSRAEQDVARAYLLQANCYVVKPLSYDQFSEVIETIEEFWFGTAELPRWSAS